jgi:hypothetical protein
MAWPRTPWSRAWRQAEDPHQLIRPTTHEVPVSRDLVALAKACRAIADPLKAQSIQIIEKPAPQALLLQHCERRQREDAQPRECDEQAVPQADADTHGVRLQLPGMEGRRRH